MKQTILITGASSGFGEAIAKKLAAHADSDTTLLLLARREEKLRAIKEELSSSPAEIILLVGDVTKQEAINMTLKPYASKVTLLINNAGLASGLEPAHKAFMKDWEIMVDTNIKGLLNVTHQILPHMAENNHGLIINMGSIAGTYPYPGGNVYGGTKAFVKQFSLNLRADLLGTKVRVTNIEPAAAETEFSLVRFRGDSKQAKDLYQNWTPFTAEDIAETVYWISSLPERMNINSIEVMATEQSFAGFQFAKK